MLPDVYYGQKIDIYVIYHSSHRTRANSGIQRTISSKKMFLSLDMGIYFISYITYKEVGQLAVSLGLQIRAAKLGKNPSHVIIFGRVIE